MDLVLIKIGSRTKSASEVQEILTKYGCNITVRLGLHEASDDNCSNDGLIILKVKSVPQTIIDMTDELKKIEAVEVKTVSF